MLVISNIELTPGPVTLEDVISKLDVMDRKISNLCTTTNELGKCLDDLAGELKIVRQENEELKNKFETNNRLIDKLENF